MTKRMIVGIVGILIVCAAAVEPPEGEFRNLKVLPRNISSRALSKIMVDDFSDALGVSCNFLSR